MPRNASAEKMRFRALIAEFQTAAADNLDEDERLLVQRIAGSVNAPAIFAKVKCDIAVRRLLSLCVEVHFLAAHFNQLIANAQNALDRESSDRRATSDIEQLLRDTQAPALNRMTAYEPPDRDKIELENAALRSIKDRLALRTRIARETILRLGATRKSRGRKAAETAAIGWMAEGVKRITKATNARLAADLAELVLGCDVSLDRVDNAADTRKREWRRS
jgi:hypothetical protein